MFKVLVIAYYYPPLGLSGVQRTLKFTKYFSQYNWKPTVITTGKSGYFALDETLLAEAEEAQVEIVRTESLTPSSLLKSKGNVNMPSSFIMKILGRISKTLFIPDNKILWSRKAAKYARTLLSQQNFDAIFVSAPPFSSIVSIIKLKQKYDIPIFIDYRDSWITNQFRFNPTPYHAYKHKKLEDIALRKVDRIIAVNRLIKEDLIKSHPFLKFNDVDIIPHGFDPADFQDIVPLDKETHKLVIAYSGIFYEGITPKYLLKAFKKLTLENPDIALNIKLQFIGHFKKENHKIVKKLKLENFIEDIGYLTHKEALTRLISSDILWIMLPEEERMFNVTPGKIFEYFGTKKPIIANLPEGVSKNLIKEYGASFITKPNDVNEIKNTLLKCHELYLKSKLPKPSDEFVNRYNRINLTEQLVKIFQFYLKTE